MSNVDLPEEIEPFLDLTVADLLTTKDSAALWQVIQSLQVNSKQIFLKISLKNSPKFFRVKVL